VRPLVVTTLLSLDGVAQLRLVVFPVSLGSGRRLFADGTVPRTWRLTSSAVSSTGAFLVVHQGAGGVARGSFRLDEG
jgi:dihydrofolate reductase